EGGIMADPQGKEGVGDILAALLGEGAGDIDALAFKVRASHLGARLSATVDRGALHVRLLTASEHLAPALDLLALMFHSPRLDARSVDSARSILARKVEAEAQSPEKVAVREWYRAMFPKHAVTRWPTRETVEGLAAADVAAHRGRLIARSNLRVVF